MSCILILYAETNSFKWKKDKRKLSIDVDYGMLPMEYSFMNIFHGFPDPTMKEVYWEIKINNLSGPRQAKFRQKSGPRFVYFDLPIYFLHG